jgi:predicted PurR-regulated permease PerM
MNIRRAWAIGAWAFVATVVIIGYLLFMPMLPVWAGFILAYAFAPIVDRLASRGWARWSAGLLVVGGIALVFAGLMALVAPKIVSEAGQLAAELPDLMNRGLAFAHQLAGRYGLPAPPPTEFPQLLEKGLDRAVTVAKSVVTAARFAVDALLVPLFFFFFLRDLPVIRDTIVSLIPPFRRPRALEILSELNDVWSGFIRGQALMAAIMACLFSLILTLFGVKYSLMIGLISGLLDLIPFFGHIIAYLTALGLTLSEFHGWHRPLALTAVFWGTTWLEGHLLGPSIIGRRVGLTAPETIVAIIALTELFGFVGLIFAIPLAGSLKLLAKDAAAAWRRSPAFEPGS